MVTKNVHSFSTVAHSISVISIWALAATSAIIITLFSPPPLYYSWLSIALALCSVTSLVLQLSLQQKNGFVSRITVSFIGAFIIFGIVTIGLLFTTIYIP